MIDDNDDDDEQLLFFFFFLKLDFIRELTEYHLTVTTYSRLNSLLLTKAMVERSLSGHKKASFPGSWSGKLPLLAPVGYTMEVFSVAE